MSERDVSAAERVLSLADLGPAEVDLDRDAADELNARAGDQALLLAGDRSEPVRVAAVVEFEGAGTDGASVLLPLDREQALLGRRGEIREILVSNATMRSRAPA